MTKNNEPLHTEHQLDTSRPSLEGHIWRQQGPWLNCTVCPRQHAIAISAFGASDTDIFLGLAEDGTPRFKRF